MGERARYPFPSEEEVVEMLTALFDREVRVTESETVYFENKLPRLVADYVTDAGKVVAVAVVDVAFGNRAGGALTLMPADELNKALETKKVEGVYLDNLREVFNIMAKFFNSGRSEHVRFRAVHNVPGVLPREVIGVYSHPAERKAYDIEIEGYGGGRVSLAVA